MNYHVILPESKIVFIIIYIFKKKRGGGEENGKQEGRKGSEIKEFAQDHR